MPKCFKWVLLLTCCLVATLLLPVIGHVSPTAYAASLTPYPPTEDCPGGGSEWWQTNYGVSYDAEYTSESASDSLGKKYGEAFGFYQLWTPVIAGYSIGCITADGRMIKSFISLYFSMADAQTYIVSTTVDNTTTTQSYSSNADHLTPPGDRRALWLAVDPHKPYTFQVQTCSASGCSYWSPHLTVTTYANVSCVNGYVWRVANPYDQVCVTPQQRTQAYYDNYFAASRVNPNGAYGSKTCVNGYVWRNAFGGDYVCVTPDERGQVAFDNYYAPYRVVAR